MSGAVSGWAIAGSGGPKAGWLGGRRLKEALFSVSPASDGAANVDRAALSHRPSAGWLRAAWLLTDRAATAGVAPHGCQLPDRCTYRCCTYRSLLHPPCLLCVSLHPLVLLPRAPRTTPPTAPLTSTRRRRVSALPQPRISELRLIVALHCSVRAKLTAGMHYAAVLPTGTESAICQRMYVNMPCLCISIHSILYSTFSILHLLCHVQHTALLFKLDFSVMHDYVPHGESGAPQQSACLVPRTPPVLPL